MQKTQVKRIIMAKYSLSNSSLSQRVKDETVILELNKGEYFELNSMAGKMLEMLKASTDTATIAKCIEAEFDTDQETIQKDLDQLITDMLSAGVLTSLAE